MPPLEARTLESSVRWRVKMPTRLAKAHEFTAPGHQLLTPMTT